MNRQRAIEITESADLIHVTHNGKRVYIQHVDEDKDIARVNPLDDPQNEFDADLDQLIER